MASLPPTHADKPISSRVVEKAREGEIRGDVRQDETTLHVGASQACDLVEEHSVARTTTTRRENRAKWLDASIGIASVAAVGAGTWLMIDSTKVHEDDTNSRTYNPTGPGKALGYGIATTGAGVALLSIPIVDLVRARRVDVHTGNVTLNGSVIKSSVPCSSQPVPNENVYLRIAGNPVNVGRTNSQGQAGVDVLAALRVDLSPQLLQGQVPVLVGTEQVGLFDLRAIHDAREAKAWASVDVASCRAPTAPNSCDSVAAFARSWIQGRYITEANTLLSQARPEIDRIREERSWAFTDLKPCVAAGSENPKEIEEACRSIEANYLNEFPAGPHADEARKAVAKGVARAEEIRARMAKKASREAAEQERRERKAAIKECRSRCLMVCSSWRFRDDSMCLVGCLQQCGDE